MQWYIQTQTGDLPSLSNEFHPVVEAILNARGYISADARSFFLSPDYERDIHDPFLFRAMEKVVGRIEEVKEKKQKVGIFGDFDADGVTSSALLRLTLDELGITNVVYLPDKITEGHGLNKKAVDFFKTEKVKLIITLDCGMMNHEEIEYANTQGVDVIIVDHHHVPKVLPNAFAIINPKLKNETYPFKELCGAGTTFKVVQALTMRLQPEKTEQLKWLLDIVALGTVARRHAARRRE